MFKQDLFRQPLRPEPPSSEAVEALAFEYRAAYPTLDGTARAYLMAHLLLSGLLASAVYARLCELLRGDE
jgi:hypothetical protein